MSASEVPAYPRVANSAIASERMRALLSSLPAFGRPGRRAPALFARPVMGVLLLPGNQQFNHLMISIIVEITTWKTAHFNTEVVADSASAGKAPTNPTMPASVPCTAAQAQAAETPARHPPRAAGPIRNSSSAPWRTSTRPPFQSLDRSARRMRKTARRNSSPSRTPRRAPAGTDPGPQSTWDLPVRRAARTTAGDRSGGQSLPTDRPPLMSRGRITPPKPRTAVCRPRPS